MSKHIKKRIKNKHQHHEEVLQKQIEEEVKAKYVGLRKHHEEVFRKQIEEELFAEISVQMTKYLKRIDYLVGGNNELASMLKSAENRCRELEENLTQWREGCVPIPNATADCIILEDSVSIDQGLENF
jgi:hypothetical protein